MGLYIAKRILWMIPIMLGVSLLVFSLMYFTPGDPAQIILGAEATPEALEECREDLGLDKPFLERYLNYAANAFLRFDLGESYINSRPVMTELLQRFPYTFRVAGISVIISALIGIPLGVMAAVNQYSWKDNGSMLLALFSMSMPNFWFALMLVLLFSLKLGWLPATGIDHWTCYILPCVAIGLNGAAGLARQTRSGMLEVIRQDYIVTARAKGQKEQSVVYGHALRNALIPIITQLGTRLGNSMGGAIIAESIFSIPGVGSYMATAIKSRDYPAVQGGVLFVAVIFALFMLLVDILYTFADPRMKSRFQSIKRKTAKVG
jgi:peptide/nickel transport system permease protein